MHTLVHLSDLHFGRTDPATLPVLTRLVQALRPDLVVVSGDLTQRAHRQEFLAARAFLDGLPHPQLVIPGNHDISLHNPLKRFLRPLQDYRELITADLEPFYRDDALAVVGLNTARSFTLKDGSVGLDQIQRTRARLSVLSDATTKVVVTHHPFDLPASHVHEPLVGRSHEAMAAFAACGVDLFLAGHFHVMHASQTVDRYRIEGHSALVIHAGTATSTRVRGESNSFNVLRIHLPHIAVERHVWQDGGFTLAATDRFSRTAAGWIPEP